MRGGLADKVRFDMALIRDIRIEASQDYNTSEFTSFGSVRSVSRPGLSSYTATIDLVLTNPTEDIEALRNIDTTKEIDLATFGHYNTSGHITLSPYTSTTTPTAKEPTMSTHAAANDNERTTLAEDIADHLRGFLDPNRIWVDHDNVGPYGGKSSVILVAAEEEGTKRVLGFAVNVYCDDTTLGKVRERVEEDRENAEVRESLGWDE